MAVLCNITDVFDSSIANLQVKTFLNKMMLQIKVCLSLEINACSHILLMNIEDGKLTGGRVIRKFNFTIVSQENSTYDYFFET